MFDELAEGFCGFKGQWERSVKALFIFIAGERLKEKGE